MKPLTLTLTLSLITLLLFAGCIFDANRGNDHKLFGAWKQSFGSNTLLLRSNHSYNTSDHTYFGYGGTYSIHGDTIVFTTDRDIKYTYKYIIDSNYLSFFVIESDGNRYVGDYIKIQ